MIAGKLIVSVAGLFLASAAAAQEVYRWVDENGVVNFSDTAPAATKAEVNTLILQDTTPRDYDPAEDLYHVAAQDERMQALRDRMAKEREARREHQRQQPQQAATPYPRAVNYGYPYGYPSYPHPPIGPVVWPPGKPPKPELYETSTLRIPGRSPNQ